MTSSPKHSVRIPETCGDRPPGGAILCGGSGHSVLTERGIRDAWKSALRRDAPAITTTPDAE